MKQLTFLLPVLMLALSCTAQRTEFKVYSSGLIYSDTTMKQLTHIVDSLNLKFKKCDLSKTYLSKAQGKAHYVKLEKGDIKAAQKDMENDISFDEFLRKYTDASYDKNLLTVVFEYKNHDDEQVQEFTAYPLERSIYRKKKNGKFPVVTTGFWVFDHSEKSEYSKESIEGFYFTEEPAARPLVDVYARLVQYSDCMVDTSTQIFKENAKETGVRYGRKTPDEVQTFITYVHKNDAKEPKYDYKKEEEGAYEKYLEQYKTWDSARMAYIATTLSVKRDFKILLDAAVKSALKKGGSDDEFEEYVALYYSPKTALELKRGRIVVGGCSMDQSPRIHAMNIAVLSAETVHWETFLRAHLDIMNDNFSRMSDGSYAWGQRQTYIRELEELDIDVTDLLLGISLRIENPGKNHYYGDIGRIGRALAEAHDPAILENRMLTMVKDHTLDDFNRLLIYYLFRNYNYYIKDDAKKKANADKLELAAKELPGYISDRLAKDKEE